MENINEKLQRLRSIFKEMGSAVISYSGGCDSTMLAFIAKEQLGEHAICALWSFEAFPETETDEAVKTADALGLSLLWIREKMLKDENFSANTPQRCYFCKKKFFSRLSEIARQHRANFIADGSNTDDLNEERPGMRAASELDVRSPLIEAGLSKRDIRKLSRILKLPTANRPSFSCLASRIPYGTRIEQSLLQRINAAEQFLKGLGFHDVRVRHHGDIARIEVKKAEIERIAAPGTRTKIVSSFRKLGYIYVTLDLHGYQTGSMNRRSFLSTARPPGETKVN